MTARQHPYQSCRDRDCERPYCLIWREAWSQAQEVIEQSWRDGFAEGLAACSRTHSKDG